MNYLRIIILGLSICFYCGCTTVTEIYVYNENGIQKKVARVYQEKDGLACFENKEQKYTINVDTRHKNWIERNIMPVMVAMSGRFVF